MGTSNVLMPDDQGRSQAPKEGVRSLLAGFLIYLAGYLSGQRQTAKSGASGSQSTKAQASGSGGFFLTLWRAVSGHLALLLIPAALLAFLLVLTNVLKVRAWPLFLLTEISAVWLGLALGWACVKEDRKRVEDRNPQDFDSFGFFYSRIAKKSPLLFEIATAPRLVKAKYAARQAAPPRYGIRDVAPTEPAPAIHSGVDDARDLVSSYWQTPEDRTARKEGTESK